MIRSGAVRVAFVGVALCASCAAGMGGHQTIRMYPGPRRPSAEVATIWSNPRLWLAVDGKAPLPPDESDRTEMHVLPGARVVEVRCRMPSELAPSSPMTSPSDQKAGEPSLYPSEVESGFPSGPDHDALLSAAYRVPIVLQPGRSYKPRARLAEGRCRFAIVDVTGDAEAAEVDELE